MLKFDSSRTNASLLGALDLADPLHLPAVPHPAPAVTADVKAAVFAAQYIPKNQWMITGRTLTDSASVAVAKGIAPRPPVSKWWIKLSKIDR